METKWLCIKKPISTRWFLEHFFTVFTFFLYGLLIKVPWSQSDVNYIAECSGNVRTIDQVKQLMVSGKVKKVIISAPSLDAPTLVLGVNHCDYKSSDKVLYLNHFYLYCM